MTDNNDADYTAVDSGLSDVIKNEYGIEVYQNEMRSEELIANGYRKMLHEEATYFAPMLQYVPQLVVNHVGKKGVETAYKAAIDNSYLCILDPSMHLATVKESTDIFLGTGLDNVTNQVSAQARWIKNNAKLTISNAPELALHVFNGISVVTGQYFMAELNSKLSDMQKGLDSLKQHLVAENKSKLCVAFDELDEIIRHAPYIQKSDERKKAAQQNLCAIQRVARNSIKYNRIQIENILKTASKKDSKNMVAENIVNMNNYLVEYRYATYILNTAKIIEIMFEGISDLEELQIYRDDIKQTGVAYKDIYKMATEWKDTYIEDNDSLNNTGWGQFFLSVAVGGVATVFDMKVRKGSSVAKDSVKMVNDWFNEKRKREKLKIVDDNQQYVNSMKAMDAIDSSVTAIETYINRLQTKTEIVSVGEDLYIRYIDAENGRDE